MGYDMTLIRNINAAFQDSPSLSPFGQIRAVGNGQRFDIEFNTDKQPLFFTELSSGAGSIDFNNASRDVSLKVTDTVTGSYRDFVQNWHNPYTPGNGQAISITGNLNGANIAGGTCEIFHKNGILGTETVYTQANWNKNTVPSVNWAYSQIFQMDFQSLKVGRIRFNLNMNGRITELHHIYNDNIRKNGFWQYPNLPVRYKLYNTATETISEIGYFDDSNGIGFRFRVPKAATQELIAICATVKSEGGPDLFDLAGVPFSVDLGTTAKTVSTSLIPLISIRPKLLYNTFANKSLFIPHEFEITSDNAIRYVLVLDPTLTGPTFVDGGGAIEYSTTSTALSGGTVFDSGYMPNSGSQVSTNHKGLLDKILLSVKPNGVQSTLTLAAIRNGSQNANVFAALKGTNIR